MKDETPSQLIDLANVLVGGPEHYLLRGKTEVQDKQRPECSQSLDSNLSSVSDGTDFVLAGQRFDSLKELD